MTLVVPRSCPARSDALAGLDCDKTQSNQCAGFLARRDPEPGAGLMVKLHELIAYPYLRRLTDNFGLVWLDRCLTSRQQLPFVVSRHVTIITVERKFFSRSLVQL